jgi:sugar lactone lactonase YvrE
VSFTPSPAAGIYRAASPGATPTLFASHSQMLFPNGFAWSSDDTLFVTDSASGTVFSINASGTATPWINDALLTGDPTACGGMAGDLSVGANGLIWTPSAIFVSNSDRGLVARIAIEANGAAGAVTAFAGPDCNALAGIDGLTLDTDGTIIAAVNRADKIVRITQDGAITTLLEGAPLDFPASVAFAGEGAARALYVTNFALARALASEPANPGIVRITF